MSVAEGLKTINVKNLDRFYIGGQWVKPSSDGKIDVISPITEEVIFTVAEAREADMDRAVAAARKAFDESPWPLMAPKDRAPYLKAFAEALRRRSVELSNTWTNQVGVLSALTKSNGPGAAATFDGYAAFADNFPFIEEHKPGYGPGQGYLVREPVGVVAGIIPWNAPLMLSVHKLAPALISGCTMVLKSSPETPLEAHILAEIAEEIGLPPGVLNVVCAHRPASEHLVRNPGVDKVSFTGSSAAGKKIASICGERMARYTMELGGKSAAVVLEDADIGQTVAALSGSLCMMSGQVCAALTRVIVPAKLHDTYADGFATAMKGMRPGDPYDANSRLGPLAMSRQLDRVEGYINKAKDEGAKLAAGGGRPADLNRGYYVEPTLFTNVNNDMTIAREEVFGPVISLIPAKNDEDALRIANDTPFGLNGAVMTKDSKRAFELARRMRTGTVAQGGFRVDYSIGFGGFKESGVGREGGRDGILPYLENKTVIVNEAV